MKLLALFTRRRWLARRGLAAVWAAVFAAVWALGLTTAHAATSPPATAADDKALEQRVIEALFWADLPALVVLHDELIRPESLDATGIWQRLAVFDDGVASVFDDRRVNDAMSAQHQALTARWVRENPNEPVAHALHMQALVKQAWRVRGGGYANTVPPHAWEEFRRLLDQAAQHAAQHAAVTRRTPLTYMLLLTVGRGLDWPDDRMRAVLEQGLQLFPHVVSLHQMGLRHQLPKWGGDALQTHRYIEQAARQHRLGPQVTGDMLYARLYSEAARDQWEHRLFEDTAADWPRLQRGFRALVEKGRLAVDRERLAYLACLARDKATFLEFEPPADLKPHWRQWGTNPQRTLDTCRSWATKM